MTDKSLKSDRVPVPDDAALAEFFEAGKAAIPMPDAALMDRVMADAIDEARLRTRYSDAARSAEPGIWAQVLRAIGGWPAAAGLAAAAATGVWIGFALPDAVGDLAYGITGASADYDLAELLPGFDVLDGEG